MGALPISQKYMTAKENVDFMKDPTTFLQVQNGISTGLQLQLLDTPLFLHNGRGLAAYTHVDVLYQAYFTAYLVLNTINGGNPAPLNPGNPYNGSKTQNGFGTMGQPDIAATLAAVAGACITVLKFFFDGDFVVPNPQIPSSDGTTLNNYTGSDSGQITVNGELHKVAHNISFGHGIHAGIHWRSDTDTSIELGEAIALSVLQDRAHTYNEKFTVKLKKLDGSIATITNQ
jgi:hypothetical protein